MCIVDKLGYGLVSRSQLRDHFRQSVRSFTRRSLQAAASGAALSLVIFAYKQFNPPADFWTAHTVQFAGHKYTLPEELSPELRSEIFTAQRACTGVDYWLAKISDSSSSLSHLQTAVPFFRKFHQVPQEISDLHHWAVEAICTHWRSIGNFSPQISRPPRSEDGHLIYGCDANVAPPEFLETVSLHESEISSAAAAVKADGFVVVRQTPVDIRKLRDLMHIKPDYLTKRSEMSAENFRTRSIDFPGIAEGETDALLDVSVHARPHLTLRLTKYESEILSEISCVMPLVWEVLAQQRPAEIANVGNFQVYISDIQLVASEPTAARTQWTAMNGNGAGVTVTVPLTFHVASEHGARLLIPGSQDLRNFGGFFQTLKRLLKFGGVAKWRPEIGDVAISDGRLMTREQANRSFSATEASLVIRFDWKDKKPAGIENPARAAFYNFLAMCLEGAGWLEERV